MKKHYRTSYERFISLHRRILQQEIKMVSFYVHKILSDPTITLTIPNYTQPKLYSMSQILWKNNKYIVYLFIVEKEQLIFVEAHELPKIWFYGL